MFKYKFSIIIAVYNIESFIAEAIESIIAQDIGFEENIQIILVDDGSNDHSGAICDDYHRKYPDNILVIHKPNGGVSSARNEGLKYADGEFVNFMDGDDKIDTHSLSAVYNHFLLWQEVELITIPVHFFEGQTGEHILNTKFRRGSRVIHVLEEYQFPLLFVNATFVTNALAREIHFDERLRTAEDAKVIMQLLLKTLCYGIVAEAKYWYRRRLAGQASAIQTAQHTREWYINHMEYFAKWCIQESKRLMGCVPRFVQYTLMYDLQWRYKLEQLPYDILSETEIQTYLQTLEDLVKNIDDHIILAQRNIYKEHKLLILKQKYGYAPKELIQKNDIIYYYRDAQVYQLSQTAVKIEFINIANDTLTLEGSCQFYEDHPYDSVQWFIKANHELIPCEIIKRNICKKALGIVIAATMGFKAALPLTQNTNYKISLICKVNDTLIEKKKLIFCKFSPIRGEMWNSYFTDGNYILTYDYHRLVITPYRFKLHLRRELSFLAGLLKKNTPASKKAFVLRILYRAWNKLPHKKVWLISDRINKADDNGEAFFKYMTEHPNKNVSCYFAISKNTEDYHRLKQIGKVIPFGGWLYKWFYICGADIISSQGEDYVFHPLQNGTAFYSDIVTNNRFVFLQHGVTKDNLSSWLNKYNKNIHLFITTTVPEFESIIRGNYYYTDSQVKLTGFARYDCLYHDEKKCITFMPTWRADLVSDMSSITGCRQPVAGFEKSQYYHMYSQLWNHPQIIAKAKELGYQLQLMIHPNMISTLPFFSLDASINVLPLDESYRKIFAESNLIITDYSSVGFDFAYLRKPVLYFQFDKEHMFSGIHTYQKGYFDYEQDGFGEVEYNLNGIVNRIIEYMEHDCKIKEKYLERVNKTFPFDDQNNCQRICDAILEME